MATDMRLRFSDPNRKLPDTYRVDIKVTAYNYSSPRLAFLVFRSRSGSTVFADRLSRHPNVLVSPESNAAPRLVEYFQKRNIHKQGVDYGELTEYLLAERKLRDWNLTSEQLLDGLKESRAHDWATSFHAICRVYRAWTKPGADVLVFKKSGWYYRNVDRLLSAYPESTSIWVVRDPRAVYNSARKAIHSEKNEPMEANILKNALGWLDYSKRLLSANTRWPDRVMKVHFESFLRDIQGTLVATWKNLGVRSLNERELHQALEQLGESHLVTPATRHLHQNVLREPTMCHAEKWRLELPAWKARVIHVICRRMMAELGYR